MPGDAPQRPDLCGESPAPGRWVRQTSLEFKGSGLYHGLYLPVDWTPGRTFPVIVEYPPNRYGTLCTGTVEDCRMGFYQSGGAGFIWVTLPFVDPVERKQVTQWWGEVDATVAYCKANVARVCERYGGDPRAVFLTGFSRGAIACGYIGLRDAEIAALWLGFLPHSHHDGGSYTPEGARERLARVRGRASLLTWGEHDNGKPNSLAGKAMLEELGSPVTALEIPGLDHTDRWIEGDSPQRRRVRAWLASALRDRPR